MPAEVKVELGIHGLFDAVEIGRGGFASVYRAFQPAFDRFVAVKVFDVALDETTPAMFERECRAIGRISGRANILTVHEAGVTTSGRPYLVMAFMAGGSLEDRLRREGPLPWREAVDVGVKLAKALDVAHKAGVLHRDVKPENILISDDGDPLLADFGIARLTNVARMSKKTALSFTPAHVAPEVLAGEPPTPAVDIYSLASTIFALIAGRPAFVESDIDSLFLIMRRVEQDPVPDLLRPRHVPETVCRSIEAAMAKNPAERPATAAAFGADLDRARQEEARNEADREQAAREQKAREQAAREQAAREQEAQEQKAQEQAAQEQAAQEQAAQQEKAQQEKAREESAQEQKAQEQKAQQEKAREEAAQQEKARQEKAEQEKAREEAAQQEAARQDAARQEKVREEAAQQEAAPDEVARQETAREEAFRQVKARQEAALQQVFRREEARQEEARQEEARVEVARQEAAREQVARQEAAREQAARLEIARQEKARRQDASKEVAQAEALRALLERRKARETTAPDQPDPLPPRDPDPASAADAAPGHLGRKEPPDRSWAPEPRSGTARSPLRSDPPLELGPAATDDGGRRHRSGTAVRILALVLAVSAIAVAVAAFRVKHKGTDSVTPPSRGVTTTSGGVTSSVAVGLNGDNGPATAALLGRLSGVAVGANGSVYIADSGNSRIRRVSPAGVITTVAGNGQSGFGGDNGPATAAQFAQVSGVAAGADGSVYIADSGNNRVRRVSPAGVITTLAGNGQPGFSGDDGPATAAQLDQLSAVAAGADGSVYILDAHNLRVRRVSPAGVITTVAGNGQVGVSGDNGQATAATLLLPSALAVAGDGSFYVDDIFGLRRVSSAGVITTVPLPNGALALSGLAVASDGSLYMAGQDTLSPRVRRMTPAGVVTTVAGSRNAGFSGDNGPATTAQLGQLAGVAVAGDGSLYIADSGNNRVRRVDPAGIITTLAGH